MQNELITSVIGLIVTILLGGLIKVYFDYKTAVIAKMWEKRLDAYMRFYKATDLFPLYPSRVNEAVWTDVSTMSGRFREWYFSDGLLLHNKLRKSYFDLQIFLNKEWDIKKNNGEEKIGEEMYGLIRGKCSALRTEMINALEVRENPLLPRLIKNEQGR